MLDNSPAEPDTIAPPDVVPASALGPCPPPERASALEILYRRMPGSTRAATIVELLRQAEDGVLDLSGLWIARRRSRIVGAMLTQALAGRVAALWPPEVVWRWRGPGLAPALVRAAIAFYRARGFRLAQALVDHDAPRRATADLVRGGLPYVTDLNYLGRSTLAPLADVPDSPRFRWTSYDDADPEEFERVLGRTYLGSLDMPELGGLRGFDDVLEGHREKGRFDPSRWRLGRVIGMPEAAAVVLLSAGEAGVWEVSYLGLTPPARGRGLGRSALAHALELARPHAQRLELAVDIRNLPADRLYRRAGFEPFDRRGVHLRLLDD